MEIIRTGGMCKCRQFLSIKELLRLLKTNFVLFEKSIETDKSLYKENKKKDVNQPFSFINVLMKAISRRLQEL